MIARRFVEVIAERFVDGVRRREWRDGEEGIL